METESLSAIVSAARSGDQVSYGRLVFRFQDMAVALAFGRLGDHELAKDAAQEAFSDAFRLLDQLREPAAFPGWFRRIVLKHCDRQTRGRAPVRSTEEEPSRVELRPQAASVDEELEARERKVWVRKAIETLPEHERTVVALHYIGGESQDAIADLLELPLSTVKKRMHSARGRLKRLSSDFIDDTLVMMRPSQTEEFTAAIRLFLAIRTSNLTEAAAILDADPGLVECEETWSVDEARDLDLPLANRATPLIRAAEVGDPRMAELLLERGAAVDGVCGCEFAESPLWAAVANLRIEVAKLLLERGANPNRVATTSGLTPLHVAALRGVEALIPALLKHGADVDRRDHRGRRPVDWAQIKGHRHVVHLLAIGALPERVAGPQPAPESAMLWTGIKAVDFFAPTVRGSRVRCDGTAGVGRNVLLSELSYRATELEHHACVWVVWETRTWQGPDLEKHLNEAGLAERVQVIMASASDSEEARQRTTNRAARVRTEYPGQREPARAARGFPKRRVRFVPMNGQEQPLDEETGAEPAARLFELARAKGEFDVPVVALDEERAPRGPDGTAIRRAAVEWFRESVPNARVFRLKLNEFAVLAPKAPTLLPFSFDGERFEFETRLLHVSID